MSNLPAVLSNIVRRPGPGGEFAERIYVVSAFEGVTDRLLEHKRTGAPGLHALVSDQDNRSEEWLDALDQLREQLVALNAEMLANARDVAFADEFVRRRLADVRACLAAIGELRAHGYQIEQELLQAREMLASVGEAHSALVLSLALQAEGVNARFVDLTGWDDCENPTLDARIGKALADLNLREELPIITGYVKCADGLVARYGRGYTEVTFAAIAVSTRARVGVIHKAVALSTADPRIVGPCAQAIGQTSYRTAGWLANLGMEAIHPHAARSLQRAGIPLRVRNSLKPGDPGTIIRADAATSPPGVEFICGMKDVIALEVIEEAASLTGREPEIGLMLTQLKARTITKASNGGSITLYLEAGAAAIGPIVDGARGLLPGVAASARQVAIVSIVGGDLNVPGLISRAAGSLTQSGVEILAVQRASRYSDIQFIVENDAYECAVRSLHHALVESREATLVPTAA